MNESIIHQLHARLPDCHYHLCSHYAEQVTTNRMYTTTADAFSAWLKWLAAEGGVPQRPLTIDESPQFRAFHERAADAIRDVAMANT